MIRPFIVFHFPVDSVSPSGPRFPTKWKCIIKMYFECDRIVIFEHGADDLDVGIGMSDKMSAKETRNISCFSKCTKTTYVDVQVTMSP